MLLTIDLGNTSLKLGLYDEDKQVAFAHFFNKEVKDYLATFKNFLYRHNLKEDVISDCIISNVVPYAYTGLIQATRRLCGRDPIILDSRNPVGINIEVDNNEEVGSDLMVISALAYEKFKSEMLIISFGSATAITHVNKEGSLRHVLICPGVEYFKDALCGLAQLPNVEVKECKHFLASNTVDAMQSGLYLGYLGMIRYLLAGLKGELQSDPKVIACGGRAKEFVDNIKEVEYYEPDMVTEGLNFIYKRYVEK